MAHPNYLWRIDELKDKRTLYRDDDGAELKIQQQTYQLWLLPNGDVRIQNRQDDGGWKVVETYPAKPAPKFP